MWGAVFLLVVVIIVAVIVTFVDPHEDREAHGLAPLAALLEGLVGVGRGPPAAQSIGIYREGLVSLGYRLGRSQLPGTADSQIPLHR